MKEARGDREYDKFVDTTAGTAIRVKIEGLDLDGYVPYTGSDKTVDLNNQILRFSQTGSDRNFEVSSLITNETSSTGSNLYLSQNSEEYYRTFPTVGYTTPISRLYIGESGSASGIGTGSQGTTKKKINTFMHGTLDVEGKVYGASDGTFNRIISGTGSEYILIHNVGFELSRLLTGTAGTSQTYWNDKHDGNGDYLMGYLGSGVSGLSNRRIKIGNQSAQYGFTGVDIYGNIKLPGLSTSGFVRTTGTDGSLSIDTSVPYSSGSDASLASLEVIDRNSLGSEKMSDWDYFATDSSWQGNWSYIWYFVNNSNSMDPLYQDIEDMVTPIETGKIYKLFLSSYNGSWPQNTGNLQVSCAGWTDSTTVNNNQPGLEYTMYFKALNDTDRLTLQALSNHYWAFDQISLKEVTQTELDVYGSIRTDDYKASDGSSGITSTKTFYTALSSGDSASTLNTVTIKNGLITDWTQV